MLTPLRRRIDVSGEFDKLMLGAVPHVVAKRHRHCLAFLEGPPPCHGQQKRSSRRGASLLRSRNFQMRIFERFAAVLISAPTSATRCSTDFVPRATTASETDRDDLDIFPGAFRKPQRQQYWRCALNIHCGAGVKSRRNSILLATLSSPRRLQSPKYCAVTEDYRRPTNPRRCNGCRCSCTGK